MSSKPRTDTAEAVITAEATLISQQIMSAARRPGAAWCWARWQER